LLVPVLAGMGAPEFRFRRAVDAPSGWCSSSFRRRSGGFAAGAFRPAHRSRAGEDVPFVDRARLPASKSEHSLVDVETLPKKGPSAIVDRGARPDGPMHLEIEVAESEFMKPVTLEASADRTAGARIARAVHLRDAARR